MRAAGARLVEVGFNELVANAGVRRTETWEYEAAFGPATAGVLYGYSTSAQPPLDKVVESAIAIICRCSWMRRPSFRRGRT